jgi:hypothetical protein
MAAGSIVVDLLMRTGSFETDSKRAEKRLQDFEKTAKKVGVGIGVALAGVGTALGASIKHALDEADEMSKLAQKIGIGTEALSHLDYAAKLSDVSLESMGNAVKRLGQFQIEALQGGKEQVAILKSIGVEAEDAANGGLRNAEAMLRDLADVFAHMPDGANKTALAVKLFGKSGADLIPLLNGGSKALDEFARKSDAAGYTLSAKTGIAAEHFNDTLTEVGLSIDGLWRQSLPELLPKLQDLAEIINSDDFHDGFQTLVNGALTAVGALAKFTTTVASTMNFLGEEVAARLHGPSLDDVVRISDRIERLKETIAAVQNTTAMHPLAMMNASELIPKDFISNKDTVLKRLQGELDKEENRLQIGYKLSADVVSGAKKVAADAGATIVLPDFTGGGTSGGGKSPRAAEAEDSARAFRDLLEADKALYDQSIADVGVQTDRINAFTDLTMQLEGPLRQAEYDHIKRMQEIARLGLESGASADAIEAAKAKETAAYQQVTAAIKEQQRVMANPEAMGLMDDFRHDAASSLSDLVRHFDQADKIIGNFFDNLAERITDAIANHWIDQLLGQSGTTGQGSAAGGSIFGWLAAAFGGAKASGGDVLGGRAYLVGEDGPEMFVPRTAGMVLDAGRTASLSSAGGGVTQNVQFLLAAPTEQRTQDQIAGKMAFQTGRAARRNR